MTASILRKYRASLPPDCNAFEFEFGTIDRLGAPLWTVALLGEDGALSDGFGYGPTLERAQTSAWGETIEWFHARESLKKTPRIFSTYAALGEPKIDPISLNLSAGSEYSPTETTLEWMQIARYPGGELFWCPIEFVAPRYADIEANADKSRFLSVPITNGSGAGPDFAHALAHGVLEQLQRDGNSASYRAFDRGIGIELDDVRDPQTRALLADLDAQGVEILVKLAATDFGMVNLYVVGYDRDLEQSPSPISLSACGEAVHPDKEFALGKALREFCMARARKAFNHGPLGPIRAIAPPGYLESFQPNSMRSEDDRALNEMRAWMGLSRAEFFEMLRDPIFEIKTSVKFSALPTTTIENSRHLLDVLSARLGAEELEIFCADFTPAGSPATIVKAVVPGLEVETMTYQRIGARNLRRLLERNSPLVGLGNPSIGAKPIRLTPENEAKFPGAWFDGAALERAIGRLYPLYREPGRHVIGFLDEN